MKKFVVIVIILCALYFIGGYIAIYFNLVSGEEYIRYSGLVGAIASVAGLLSFTRPMLSRNDIQKLEIESLKGIVESTEELNRLEETRAKTKEQIDELYIKRKEMEVLVKKASLILFLKDQHKFHERRIINAIRENSELSESLNRLREIELNISRNDDEIKSDPNVEQLNSILSAVRRREDSLNQTINELSPMAKVIAILAKDMVRTVESLSRILLR